MTADPKTETGPPEGEPVSREGDTPSRSNPSDGTLHNLAAEMRRVADLSTPARSNWRALTFMWAQVFQQHAAGGCTEYLVEASCSCLLPDGHDGRHWDETGLEWDNPPTQLSGGHQFSNQPLREGETEQ